MCVCVWCNGDAEDGYGIVTGKMDKLRTYIVDLPISHMLRVTSQVVSKVKYIRGRFIFSSSLPEYRLRLGLLWQILGPHRYLHGALGWCVSLPAASVFQGT